MMSKGSVPRFWLVAAFFSLTLFVPTAATMSIAAVEEALPAIGIGPHRQTDDLLYLFMRERSGLRSNGDGEEALEFVIENSGYSDIAYTDFYITTYTGEYSNMRTWDSQGAIDHRIIKNDKELEIRVYFRAPVPAGETYRFHVAIELGDIVEPDGDGWSFRWGTYFDVAEFERVVDLPPGSEVTYVAPAPTQQSDLSLLWQRQNMSALEIAVDYTLRPLTNQELIEKYAPYLRMHPNDPFVPMSIDLALAHATEIRDHGGSGAALAGPLTAGVLGSAEWRDRADAYIDFPGAPSVNSVAYYTANIQSAADASPTFYVQLVTTPGGMTVIQYWFYYFTNFFGSTFGFNSHEGDWEMIQVILDANEVPYAVAFAQHGSGSSREWNDIERMDTHPLVYAARGSHASYMGPFSFLAGRDQAASETTEIVIPKVVTLFPLSAASWTFYKGHWGQSDLVPGFGGPVSPSAAGTKWDDPLVWYVGLPWDEDASHHYGKVKGQAGSPCNVMITHRLNGKRFGWRYNEKFEEIDNGEYVVNELAGKRTALLHDTVWQPNALYRVEFTCEQSTTPSDWRSVDLPVPASVQFYDAATQEWVTAIYGLPFEWDVANTLAYVDLEDGGDLDLRLDEDGDGQVDVVLPPVQENRQPYTPPDSTAIVLFAPVVLGD